ncbi:DUF2254 domain-containing protein, partial [uncultured Thiodictyon sp.]
MKLAFWWQETRASFWFLPALIVLDAVALAALLITLDFHFESNLAERWPLLFGAGADGARGLLSAVGGSMVTVAGVVFSITLVAIALTSSQYTSRVIRNFMSDHINQSVLGTFVGIFAYCLVVLRTIRGGDEGGFVPTLAVLGALILAFVGIGVLIYFIHYVSTSIQASSITASVARETLAAVDHLFPEALGDNPDAGSDDQYGRALAMQPWLAIPAQKTGYIETIESEQLLTLARAHATILRMERGIGDFVVAGTPLVSAIATESLKEAITAKLNALYVIGRQRTVEQDAAFGVRQIVDIAMKALSPGVNDTTTAIMCVDYLTAILVRLAPRRIAAAPGLDEGELRVIARGPSFGGLLAEAFDQIRQNAGGNVGVLLRMLGALETIATRTTDPHRRCELQQTAEQIGETAERTVASPHDRERLGERLARVR